MRVSAYAYARPRRLSGRPRILPIIGPGANPETPLYIGAGMVYDYVMSEITTRKATIDHYDGARPGYVLVGPDNEVLAQVFKAEWNSTHGRAGNVYYHSNKEWRVRFPRPNGEFSRVNADLKGFRTKAEAVDAAERKLAR